MESGRDIADNGKLLEISFSLMATTIVSTMMVDPMEALIAESKLRICQVFGNSRKGKSHFKIKWDLSLLSEIWAQRSS